jgi:hypothetical protein
MAIWSQRFCATLSAFIAAALLAACETRPGTTEATITGWGSNVVPSFRVDSEQLGEFERRIDNRVTNINVELTQIQ